MTASASAPKRLQGVLVTEEEVRDVVDFLSMQDKKEDKKDSDDEVFDEKNSTTEESDLDLDLYAKQREKDSLYDDAKQMVLQHKKASTSLLQRRLRIGYNRAARLIDELEENGVIGQANGSKPREILIEDSSIENDIPTTKKVDV